MILDYVGFVAIGGEWLSTRQSVLGNGEGKAVTSVTCSALALVVLLLPEVSD